MIARRFIVLVLCAVGTIASAQGDAAWMRYAALSRDGNEYHVVSRGRDQQLEAAVTALLALIR